VHHVAILVSDLFGAAQKWRDLEFVPLTPCPLSDGGLLQWFLQNRQGQIVELIHRPRGGQATD
jgi:hypothetical protein